MTENDAGRLADISAAIREYLTDETDVTRPSFHATAIAARIAPLLKRDNPSTGGVMTAFPDAWEPLGPRWAACGCCVVVDYVALLEVTEEAS